MSRTNLFFKVEVEHDREEKPERIGAEICRQLLKLYGVRAAELVVRWHPVGKQERGHGHLLLSRSHRRLTGQDPGWVTGP